MNVQGGRLGPGLRLARVARWDILWAVFVGLNLAAMRLLPEWQTVPFLAIWVSLTLVYALRLWPLQPALLTLTVVTLATGGIIGAQVIRGQQDADYLVLVPLVAVMFLVMVWHGRRRLAALEEKLAALEEVQRVSRENLRLLERQRLFLLDASHELGTPITVALGHAELIEQAAADQVAEDARVVVAELGRLRKQASRMLLLASADDPGFLELGPFPVDTLLMNALERWGYTPRRWRLGEVAEASVTGDQERLAVALDALLENAIAHTGPEDLIELSVRLAEGEAVFAVADSGCGIPADELERIFDRFSRGHPSRDRESGGFGLGLPTVRAIAAAHHGSVRVRSTVGEGSTFEVLVPATPAAAVTDGRPRRANPRFPALPLSAP
jgi:two-component system OmpR family sensor kinase